MNTTIYKEDFTGDNWLCIIRDLELPVDTDEIIVKYISHITSTLRQEKKDKKDASSRA